MYEEDIIDLFLKENCEIEGDETPLCYYKGFAVRPLQLAIINLSAAHWNGTQEDIIINQMSKTIAHELSHLLITQAVPLPTHNLEYEEWVCAVLADQQSEMAEQERFLSLHQKRNIY